MMKIISYTIAIAVALSLSICLAALSAAYWATELADQATWKQAVTIIGSIAVSLMVPASAFFIRSNGWILGVSVVIFFTCDTYQNTQGWQTFQHLAISDEIKAAESRLSTAQKALEDIPNPSATGEIRNRQTWLDTIAVRKDLRDEAKAELEALTAPATEPLHVAIAMGLIQIALSIFFAAMGTPKKRDENLPAEESETEVESTRNVLVFSHRAKPMTQKDMAAWNAISKQA